MRNLLKKIKTIFSQSSYKCILKIVDVIGNLEQKNIEVVYQMIGKACLSQESPKKLVEDLLLLRGFSITESHLIHDLFLAQRKAPNYKIVGILFDNDCCQFEIVDVKSSTQFILSAAEMMESESFLQNFSIADIKRIAHQYWQDYFLAEKKNLRHLKQSGKVLFLCHSNEQP